MRSVISKSMMLGLALVAISGCSTSGDKSSSPQGDLGQIKMNVVLGAGNTLDSVTWTLSCTTAPPVTTGTWDVSKSATISGVIGGVPAGDVCSLTIAGTDTLGKAGGLTNNCTGTASNISAGSTGAISVTCNDPGNVTPAGSVTSIGSTATITTVAGASHTCAGVASFTASPGEVFAGNTIALAASTTTLTTGDTATTSWSSDDGFTATGLTATYPCNNIGTHTIMVSVQDNITGYTSACPANTAQFTVTCSQPLTGTGGAPATGGSSSLPPATGGAATGGAATGGTPPTGGSPATGGSSAAPPPPGPELALLQANSAACGTCAQTNCSNFLDNAPVDTAQGFGSCQTVTGSANATNFDQTNEPWAATTWAGDPMPFTAAQAAAGGVAVTPFQLCLNLTTCLVQSKCDQGVLSACFCGAAQGTDCINGNNYPGGCADPTNPTVTKGCAKALTGPINGACAGEEQNALDTNAASSIPTAFADVTLPGGPANQLVNCLANKCPTQCGM